MLSIDELVEEIRQLSAGGRRKLLRRLRINGLLVLDEPLTDRDPLRVATALGLEFSDQSWSPEAAVDSSETDEDGAGEDGAKTDGDEGFVVIPPEPRGPFEPTSFDGPNLDHNDLAGANGAATDQDYDAPAQPDPAPPLPEPVQIDLNPSAGKVVMGAPQPKTEQAQDPDDPHAMAPVPGQGPSGTIRLVFDGGSKGNPGYGYGSYALEWPGEPEQVVRLQHGNNCTSNEAEYDTLLKALEAVFKRLDKMGAEPSTAEIDIRGDSQLVINQVMGEWQCKNKRLKPRCKQAQAMLNQFGYWEIRHHGRENSVRILGH